MGLSFRRATPALVREDEAYFVPTPGQLDMPRVGAGVPLTPFAGYQVNTHRMNGEDINPQSLQTMRVAYFDGVQLFNGVDGITSKRFGPGQFYVLSDAYPGQKMMVPHGMPKNQTLTASDIALGPAGAAANQATSPGSPGGPVLPPGASINYRGGC